MRLRQYRAASVRRSVSTWQDLNCLNDKDQSGQASHAHVVVDTGSTRIVKLSEWESTNGKSVCAARRSFTPPGQTASAVLSAAGNMSSNRTGIDGIERTSRRATTKRVLRTTPGRAGRLPPIIRRRQQLCLLSAPAARRSQQYSSTTKTETAGIPHSTIWSGSASAATSWSTTVLQTCRVKCSSNHVSVSCATTSLPPLAPAECGVLGVGKYAQRYSQCPQKCGARTINYGMRKPAWGATSASARRPPSASSTPTTRRIRRWQSSSRPSQKTYASAASHTPCWVVVDLTPRSSARTRWTGLQKNERQLP